MEYSNFEMFEFTTQEESGIKEVLESLAEVTCVLLVEGVKTDEACNVNVLDIISYILENTQKGRADAFHFAVLGFTQNEGILKVLVNEGAIGEKSVKFLEEILMRQLEFFEAKIPKAVEIFKRKNFDMLETGTNISQIAETSHGKV